MHISRNWNWKGTGILRRRSWRNNFAGSSRYNFCHTKKHPLLKLINWVFCRSASLAWVRLGKNDTLRHPEQRWSKRPPAQPSKSCWKSNHTPTCLKQSNNNQSINWSIIHSFTQSIKSTCEKRSFACLTFENIFLRPVKRYDRHQYEHHCVEWQILYNCHNFFGGVRRKPTKKGKERYELHFSSFALDHIR